MTMGEMPSFLNASAHWNVLPCPLPPQMPRISGTLILGRSMKFLATWMVSLSRKAGEM